MWLAVTGDLVTAMLAIGVAVAGLLLLDVVNTTLIQRIVPDELRGRAMGVLQTTSAMLYSLGSLLVPLIADATSVAVVLIGSGGHQRLGVAAALLLTERVPEPAPIDPARARLLEHPIFAGLPVPRLEAAVGARAGPGHRRRRWWYGRAIRRIGSTSLPRALSASPRCRRAAGHGAAHPGPG